MATGLTGLFTDPQQQQWEQQQAFSKQLGGITDPRAFVAAVGSNLGSQIGGGLMRAAGMESPLEQQQRAIKEALASTQETDPVKKLRAVAEKLRAMGMEEAALKVDAQADDFEDRGLKRQERAEKIKKAQERPQMIADRTQVLMKQYNMSEVEAKTIAENDTSWNSYIKPAKEYAPSEFGKMMQEAGIDPNSTEYKTKMKQYAESKLKKDDTAMAQVALLTKQVELQLQQMKLQDAQAKASAAEGQKQLRQYMMEASTGQMVSDIDAASKLVDKASTGWGAVMQFIPGSDGMRLKDKLTTIKANIGFDKLQQMRAASPTGGALGQVAIQELVALQSSLASLNQWSSPETLKENLGKIKQHYQGFLKAQKDSIAANEPLTGEIVTGAYDTSVNPTSNAPAPSSPAAGTPKPTLRYNPATKKLEPV